MNRQVAWASESIQNSMTRFATQLAFLTVCIVHTHTLVIQPFGSGLARHRSSCGHARWLGMQRLDPHQGDPTCDGFENNTEKTYNQPLRLQLAPEIWACSTSACFNLAIPPTR